MSHAGGLVPLDRTAATVHLDAHRIPGPEACGRVLVVGERNPLSADPRYALYHEPAGSAGHRLQSVIFGLSPRRSYLPLWRTNLCLGEWDTSMAASRALTLLGDPEPPWSVLVGLGVRVSERLRAAAGLRELELFSVAHLVDRGYGSSVVSIPHPSGLSRAWNRPGSVERARALLRSVAPDVPWGEVDSAGSSPPVTEGR